MATINVIYEDLYNTEKALDKVIDYIDSAKSQLDTIKNSVEELDSKHECFSMTSTEITDLEIAFENYSTEVKFLKNQCNNAANAFKDAEGENVKLTDAMKGVISDAAIMLGDDSLKDNPEIDVFKNRDAFTKSGTTLQTIPGVDTSATWSNTFVDKDNDKLVEINSAISSDASTILNSEEKKEEDNKTDKSGDPTPSNNNYSDEDNDSGGHHSTGGSPSYSPTYTPTNTTPTNTTPTNTTPTDTTPTDTADLISDVNIDDNNEAISTTPTINDSAKSNTDTTASNNSSSLNNTQQTNQISSDYSQLDANRANSSEVSGFQPTGNQDATYPSTTPSYNYVGGSYSEDTGYTPANEEIGLDNGLENLTNPDLENQPLEDANNSINDIIKKGKYTKIPESSVPIQQKTKSTGNAVIPVAAGISAAAAAGIGAKAYMDHKNNSTSDDEIDTEDWSEDDSLLEIEENDSNTNEELSSEDEYSYQQETEKYSTRDTSEITEM